jgi:hypothetical protein
MFLALTISSIPRFGLKFKKSGDVKVKKIIGCLLVMTFFTAALMVGCNGNSNPSNAGSLGTQAFMTPQTTPQAMVDLKSAANFAVLSYAGITNSGATTVCGSLGTFPNASVGGGLIVICGGTRQVATTPAGTAETDLGSAYTDAMGRTGGAAIPAGGDIGGQTLYPGLYTDKGNLNLKTADLTVDAQGNTNGVFIIQVTGDLIVASGRKVNLINGAKAANVFWAVTGFCSMDTTASFVGNVMAHTAVTFNTGAALEGRALASTQNVTFLANNITFP